VIKEVGRFLHIIDDDGQLDLTDLAFIAIIVKIMCSSTLDFPAVVTLATVCINKMHRRQVDSTSSLADDSSQVKEMSQQIADLQTKISPIIDQIKGVIK
jgi:hypothetical protein